MKRWMKKFAAVVATAAMVCSVGMPAFAVNEFNGVGEVTFQNDGHGQYTRLDIREQVYNSVVGNELEVVQALPTEDEGFYKVSETQYLVQAYDDVYTMSSKVELDPIDVKANTEIFEMYEISEALQKDITENIERENRKNNSEFIVELYVPSTVMRETSTFQYNGHLLRNVVANYKGSSVGPIGKEGVGTKDKANSLFNAILSTVGVKSKTVSLFGAGKSALDVFIAVHGPVIVGTSDDKTWTMLDYNSHTKEIDYYNPIMACWEEGCLTRYAELTKNTTYQFYGSTGKSYTTEKTLSEVYTSEHYDDPQFAINTAPVLFIDGYIYTEFYDSKIKL